MKKKVFLHIICLFIPVITFSQVGFGSNLGGQKWRILSSPSVRVIYPVGMESKAQRIANITNYIDKNNTRSIGNKTGSIDIVLQNQTIVPNAYVGLAPFRSEFFCTPPSTNNLVGSLDWVDVLTIHEYRHVQQIINSRRGISKVASIFQGQSGWSLLSNLSLPNWYFEGDATIAETAWSLGGRGRSAFFTMEQRALAYAGINYYYQKNRNGSYKSMIPDRYRLGFMMLTKARELKGNDVTAKVLKDAVRYKGIIYPFSKALKRNVGYNSKNLYKLSWDDSKLLWADRLKSASLINTTPVTQKNMQTVTDYNFPRTLKDGSIIAIKSSYKQTERIVSIKNGIEKTLTTVGIAPPDNFFGIGNRFLTWIEIERNPRRERQTFSNIVIYDLNTKSKTRFTSKSRYFSPVASPDGNTIAAINVTPNQECNIHLLDIFSGKILKKIENPANYFLSRIAWTNDGKNLISIAKKQDKVALVKIESWGENNIVELTDWTRHTLEAPSIFENKVYFSASYSGIDNIYCVDLGGNKKINVVSSVPVGAFEPEVSKDGKSIYFTEFTEAGYMISKQGLKTELLEYQVKEPHQMPFFETVANQNEGGNILEKVPTQQFSSKSYLGLFRGLKLHSWTINPSPSNPRLSIEANNILNDVSLVSSVSINRNEANSVGLNTEFKIGRYFPEFTFGLLSTKRNTSYLDDKFKLINQYFNENGFSGKINIPLNWINGNFQITLAPNITITQHHLSNVKNENGTVQPNSTFLSSSLGLKSGIVHRTALQNVGPRLGVMLQAYVINTVNGSNASKIDAQGTVYLPGIGKNHNISLRTSYQKEALTNTYQFSDTHLYSRGYKAPANDAFKLISVNYGLPLLYPDAGIAGITYFKRVRANLFYDYGIAETTKSKMKNNFRSTGAEIIFDNTLLNTFEISTGLRTSILLDKYPSDSKSARLEFFISLEY